MSGLVDRLRRWLGSLFGGDADEGDEPARVCAVCGTAVDDPDEGCPLCGSHDLAPPAGDGGAASDPDGDGDGATGGTPEPERRSVEGTTDDAVTRLRDV